MTSFCFGVTLSLMTIYIHSSVACCDIWCSFHVFGVWNTLNTCLLFTTCLQKNMHRRIYPSVVTKCEKESHRVQIEIQYLQTSFGLKLIVLILFPGTGVQWISCQSVTTYRSESFSLWNKYITVTGGWAALISSSWVKEIIDLRMGSIGETKGWTATKSMKHWTNRVIMQS